MVARATGDEDGPVASPTVTDAPSPTTVPAPASVDALYDAPYIIFVYAAWVGSGLVVSDTAALAILVAASAVLTASGLIQCPPFRPHSFAADLSTILLFCGAAIGAGWFVVQGLASAPLPTALALGAAGACACALAMAPDQD